MADWNSTIAEYLTTEWDGATPACCAATCGTFDPAAQTVTYWGAACVDKPGDDAWAEVCVDTEYVVKQLNDNGEEEDVNVNEINKLAKALADGRVPGGLYFGGKKHQIMWSRPHAENDTLQWTFAPRKQDADSEQKLGKGALHILLVDKDSSDTPKKIWVAGWYDEDKGQSQSDSLDGLVKFAEWLKDSTDSAQLQWDFFLTLLFRNVIRLLQEIFVIF